MKTLDNTMQIARLLYYIHILMRSVVVHMEERWTADQWVARSSLNAGGVTMACP